MAHRGSGALAYQAFKLSRKKLRATSWVTRLCYLSCLSAPWPSRAPIGISDSVGNPCVSPRNVTMVRILRDDEVRLARLHDGTRSINIMGCVF
jgi:hypothetical protein